MFHNFATTFSFLSPITGELLVIIAINSSSSSMRELQYWQQ
jgi:hypothetical protein